jgi:putative DNA-invertase from lambdoid prophage Rac
MIYAYLRVSTDKQSVDNQRYELLRFADEKKLAIARWVEETVSSTKKLAMRKLGPLIAQL